MNIEEAAELIRSSIQKYPASQPQDIIKLLYQSSFGPAHAIKDAGAAYEWLLSEYRSAQQREGPLLESIGNGYARLDLHTLDHNGVSPEAAAAWFVQSAVPAGAKDDFAALLFALAEEALPIDMPAFNEFVQQYVALGCPAVHHSLEYSQAYSPAYRVVKEDLIGLLK